MRTFLASESAGGMLLIAAAALAMVLANTSLSERYFSLLDTVAGPALSPKLGPMTLRLWINDALMAVFFFLIGMEIKRAFHDRPSSSPADWRLPIIAAGAGMLFPATIYLSLTSGTPGLARGWAIPTATDIAFALGLLTLAGDRVPPSLKLFLTTVAIADDVGAVAIIALFYTTALDWTALGLVLLVLAGLSGINRAGARKPLWYALGFILLWYFTLQSGVHATISGVIAALAVPVTADEDRSTLHRMERALSPWVAFAIVPLFGFANAGVALDAAVAFSSPLTPGVALGLFVGKQTGIFGSVWLAAKFGIAQRPAGTNWTQLYGMALLCGIGFTMSLFIGGLAFPGQPQGDAVKIGVLAGSLLSAAAGTAILRLAGRP